MVKKIKTIDKNIMWWHNSVLIGDNNESIWESKVEITDEMLVKYKEKNWNIIKWL